MTGVFPNSCPSCSTPLASIRGAAKLTAERPDLHCALCGVKFGPYSPPLNPDDPARVFLDMRTREYRFWTPDSLPEQPEQPEEVEETVSIGAFSLRIQCRTLRIQHCLFERVFVFRPEDNAWGHREAPQFSPLRPEREYLIARWSLVGGGANYREYKVTTNTGWTRSVVKPCAEIPELAGQSGAALFIWPNFVAQGWNRYYVTFYPPSIPTLFGSGGLHQIWTRKAGSANAAFEQVPVHHNQGGELLARPDRIVLSWLTDGVVHFSSWRSDLDEPAVPHLERIEFVRAENLNIGFDFGTTNTAAAANYRLPDMREEPLKSLGIHNRTLRLLSGAVSADLQLLPQPDGDKPLNSLPTQLMFESAQLLQEVPENIIAPLQFTIPYYQSESVASETRSVGQFKWAKALGELRKNAARYRALYLRLSLEMFLAEVVGELHIAPSKANVVATYPLSFTPEDLQLHRNSLQAAHQAVEPATGFTLFIGPSLDESHAGQNCDIPNRPGEYSLFIDVGGGTTDVCLSAPDGQDILVVDSVEYGGEHLNDRVFKEQLTNHSPQQFRREIRIGGGAAFRSSDLFARDNAKFQRIGKVRTHLQRGLVEYAARYIAAQIVSSPNSNPVFTVYMLGLGWMTIFAHIDPLNAIAEEFSKKLNARLQEMKTVGLVQSLPSVTCKYPENPKAVVARGAARCYDVLRQAPENSERSFMLQNLRIVTASGENVHPWSTRIPVKSDAQILQLQAIDLAKFGFETSLTLPSVPEPSTWPNELLQSCVYQNEIVHSPFRVYLSAYKNAG